MESWYGPILFGPVFGPVLGLLLALVLVCVHLWLSLRRQNIAFQSLEARLSETEQKLGQERDEAEQQRKLALSLLDKNGLKKVFDGELAKVKKDFDEKLKSAQEEAEKKIDFSVVQYKKTITKKRKIANRKAEKTKPPRRQIWRSIDAED